MLYKPENIPLNNESAIKNMRVNATRKTIVILVSLNVSFSVGHVTFFISCNAP